MLLALGAVLVSAACTGTANILQAREAGRVALAEGLDPGLLLRLVRRGGYLLALVLLVTGMLLAIYALRTLPLFVVQAGRAASLGVTAVLSVLVLGTRLYRYEVSAVVAVAAGLAALALSAGPQQAADVPGGPRFGLLGAVAVVALAAAAVSRRRAGPRSGLVLAVLAGLCFAVLALGARILRGFSPAIALADPAAWAMAGAGLLGLLLSASALQRASVVTVTAAMVGTETSVGALLGVVLCGDHPEPGATAYASVGYLLVLAGALALARYGAPLPGRDAAVHGLDEPSS